MAVRAPHLHLTLRAFCLGAFVFLGRALEEGDDLPFAFEEHVQRGGPALYEYRPLVRTFVESRASALARPRGRADRARRAAARAGGRDLRARPRRRRSRPRSRRSSAPCSLSLLISTAEACGGFDWDDRAFERAYAELEHSLFGASRAYAAVAPLVGHLRRDAGRARRRDPHARGGDRRARRTTGPRRRGCSRRTSAARSTATACSSSSASSEPGARAARRAGRARRRRLRDPARHRRARRRRARCCSSGSTGGRSGSGRCCRSRRRSRRASRRGSTRSAPSSRASCSRGSRSPTPTRRSPRRSTAGSSRSSRTSRSAPSSCAARSPACSATTLGAPRGRAARRRQRGAARDPRGAARARRGRAGVASAPRLPSGARSSRRCGTATGRRSSRSLDDALLGLRSAPRLASHRVDRSSRFRDERVALPSQRAASVDRMDEARVLARLDRIDALDRTECGQPASCSRSCGACSARPRRLAREPDVAESEDGGGGRAPTHGAGTGHNRHVIAHWDEVESGRAEAGRHRRGAGPMPRLGRRDEDGRRLLPRPGPDRPARGSRLRRRRTRLNRG